MDRWGLTGRRSRWSARIEVGVEVVVVEPAAGRDSVATGLFFSPLSGLLANAE